MKNNIGIYIHIPFCIKKCLYCDFNSFSEKNNYFEKYKNSLISEIKNFKNDEKLKVDTIFFGGGTPSVLPAEYITEILNTLKEKFDVDKAAEISIEVNPGTADLKKFKTYKNSGINRISFGVQTTSDRLLKLIGRIHNKNQVFESFEMAKKAGFTNINADLMFALPTQTLADLEETLQTILSLSPTHISLYSLIIEEGTPLYDMFQKGIFSEVSQEYDRKMYYIAKKILKEKGFLQYEISNFAKDSFSRCRHNINYWKRGEYLGFGLSACSFFNERRYTNTNNLDEYLNGNYLGDSEKLKENDALAEFMFLGLRMNEGITEEEFFNYFGKELFSVYETEINENIKKGLIAKENGRIFLTEKGFDVSNSVFIDFLGKR